MVNFVFSTFQAPGQAGMSTSVGAINDFGQIAGTFSDGSGNEHVYVRTAGRYDTAPVSPANAGFHVTGLNNLDLVVGSGPGGFGANVVTQQFDPFTRQFNNSRSFVDPFPNFPATGGVNDFGEVVGSSLLATPSGTIAGTPFIETDGKFTSFELPAQYAGDATEATGINDLGQITGFYNVLQENSGFIQSYGFIDTNGMVKTINVGPVTEPVAINNFGEGAGNVSGGGDGPVVGFVDIGGQISPVEYPGATNTVITGINDFGQIVGDFYTDAGTSGPFIATPVPASNDQFDLATLRPIDFGLVANPSFLRRLVG